MIHYMSESLLDISIPFSLLLIHSYFSPILTIYVVAFLLQASSLNAVASLVNTDALPLEALVPFTPLSLFVVFFFKHEKIVEIFHLFFLAEFVFPVSISRLESWRCI